ncbi:MAG TPA: MarR family transcriptional regulator [Dongiaceae bacterium]|jgi:DNA-binding MarR family transcriptional regulator|nr:MarR family transcriptional regulator [Dongiaceae bacterium]
MPNPPTLGFVLHEVARLLKRRFEQKAKGLGLTRSQWQTLAYLNIHEGIQQGKLADILEIESITLVRILDRLEARGLIERRQHPSDRRVWQLYLLDEARPLIAEMQKIGDATRAEALAGVSAADRDRLLRILKTMKGNLAEACLQAVEPAPDQTDVEEELDHA